MQSVHGTGEPGLDAIKVTNWNLANKVVTLAYFKENELFGNCFPKKQSDNKRVTSNPKSIKNQPTMSPFSVPINPDDFAVTSLSFSPSGALVAISP